MKKLGILVIVAAFLGLNYSCEINLPEIELDGKVVFWSDFDGPVIDVYVDDVYKGSITSLYYSAPSCGASGCVTVTLPVGTYYNWDAEEDAYPWRTWNSSHSTSFDITSGGCYTMRLWTSSKGADVEGSLVSNDDAKVIGYKK